MISELVKQHKIPPYRCRIRKGIIFGRYGLIYTDLGRVYLRFLDWARVPPKTDLRRPNAIKALGKGLRSVVLLGEYGFTGEIEPSAVHTACQVVGAFKLAKGQKRPDYHGHPLTDADAQPWLTAPTDYGSEEEASLAA